MKAGSAEPVCSGLLLLKRYPSQRDVCGLAPIPRPSAAEMSFAPFLYCGCLRANSRPCFLEPTAETIHPVLTHDPGTILSPLLT